MTTPPKSHPSTSESTLAARRDRLLRQLTPASLQLFPQLYYSAATNSTNDDCWADKGAICCSQRQLQGRGQYGRVWDDQLGEQLFISWRLPQPSPVLPLVAALSVCVALEERFHLGELQIKWPNDLLYGEAKLAGLLVEARTQPGGDAGCVCGLGLNIVSAGQVDAQRAGYQAASLDSILRARGQQPVDHIDLAAIISNSLATHWYQLQNSGFADLRARWLERAYCLHEKVCLTSASDSIVGVFEGIDEQGALLLGLRDQGAANKATRSTKIISSNYSLRRLGALYSPAKRTSTD